MNIGELKTSPRKKRKRVGRGYGTGNGKTAGRGHKGQGARSGSKRKPWFEGGQMPLQRRVPKRGFKSLNRKEYQVVNLQSLERFADGDQVGPQQLQESGLIKKAEFPIKILGTGELSKRLVVEADAFSRTAKDKIVQLGGETSIRSLQASPPAREEAGA